MKDAIDVPALFEAFGGTVRLAEAVGVPISTAHHWKKTGSIPKWRQSAVLEAARQIGVSATTDAA